MKILTISSHYPPYHYGGYEIRVKNILDGLSDRGHEIRVLTNPPENGIRGDISGEKYPVIRRLHNRSRANFFPAELLFDLLDTQLAEQHIKSFQPDLVYLGHTHILSKALLPYLAQKDIPIIYDEGGTSSIEAWTEHGRWFRFCEDYRSRFTLLNWIKPLVIRMVVALSRGRIQREWTWPQNMRIIFNSELNRSNAQRNGVTAANSTVIHSGIDTKTFNFKPREKPGSPLQILVPGRIEKRKGQLDAIYLVKKLLEEGIDSHLVMAGAGWVDGYSQEVTATIRDSELPQKFSIFPMLEPMELDKQYQDADICFFPSYQKVGFSRVPLEAMACGCIVISYGNEGSDEIIRDHENGFILEEGDIEAAVNVIGNLINNLDMAVRIRNTARKDIETSFNMVDYIDKIDNLLHAITEYTTSTLSRV